MRPGALIRAANWGSHPAQVNRRVEDPFLLSLKNRRGSVRERNDGADVVRFLSPRSSVSPRPFGSRRSYRFVEAALPASFVLPLLPRARVNRGMIDIDSDTFNVHASPGDLREEAFYRRLVDEAVVGLGGLDFVVCDTGRHDSLAPLSRRGPRLLDHPNSMPPRRPEGVLDEVLPPFPVRSRQAGADALMEPCGRPALPQQKAACPCCAQGCVAVVPAM
jgi:hypothetical protein